MRSTKQSVANAELQGEEVNGKMNELIKVDFTKEHPTVSARDLHEALEIKTAFRHWMPRMIGYGFTEHVDFEKVYEKCDTAGGPQTMVDFEMSIDMAKHVCMLQRSEKGMLYRQYFLGLEKAWNTPEKVMARALQIAERQIGEMKVQCGILGGQVGEQKKQIAQLAPKAEYLDEILHSDSLVLTTQIAKDYGMSAIAFNRMLHELGIQYRVREQWVLYRKYQDRGYTRSTVFKLRHTDGTIEAKYQTEWTQEGRLFLYHILKENGCLPVIEQP